MTRKHTSSTSNRSTSTRSTTRSTSASAPRKVVDAKEDNKGNITHVKLEGNQNFTPKDIAVGMAEQGKIKDVHVVHQKDVGKHLRTDPDGKTANNLDTMAQD